MVLMAQCQRAKSYQLTVLSKGDASEASRAAAVAAAALFFRILLRLLLPGKLLEKNSLKDLARLRFLPLFDPVVVAADCLATDSRCCKASSGRSAAAAAVSGSLKKSK